MKFSKEFRVGIVALVGILVIVLFFYLSGSLSFLGGGYKIFVSYRYLSNLPIGGLVKLVGGIKVGYISDVIPNSDGEGVIVVLVIDRKYKINKDAIFVIQATSLVGEKYIDIINYNGTPPYLNDGDRVKGDEGVSLTGAISELYMTFRRLMHSLEGNKQLQRFIYNVSFSLESIKSILDKFDNSSIFIVRSATNTLRSIEDFSIALRSIDKFRVDQILNNALEISRELKITLSEINKILTNDKSVVKFLNDESIYTSLRKIMSNLEIFSDKLAKDPSHIFSIRSLVR